MKTARGLLGGLIALGLGAGVGHAADRTTSMSAFVDAAFARQMQAMAVPGAAIVVVEDGRVVLQKGYGQADVAANRPVDPETTAFRMASVGKAFTALAVLKMAEQGRLNLDRPVSVYAPDLPGLTRQVTLRRLLLHTAGLDERLIGYQSRDAAGYEALGPHLRARLPAIRDNAARIPTYSNYGYAVAGYAVERAAGAPFRDYLSSQIFRPLGMDGSFYTVPPIDGRTPTLAKEYTSGGALQAITYSKPYPAGGAASTAADMGRFIRAFLAAYGGEAGGAISPAVARAMLTRELATTPDLGEGLGLNRQRVGGRLVWLKGGAGPKHSAVLVLLPERNAGVFIAVNRQEPLFWETFLPAFLRAFYPEDPAAASTARPAPDAGTVAGVYEFTRVSRSSIEKLAAPLLQVTVTAQGSDTVTLTGLIDDLPKGGFRRSAGLYRNGDRYLAFEQRGGRPVMFASMSGEHAAFRRVAWWEQGRVQAGAAVISLAIILAFPVLRGLATAWAWIRPRGDHHRPRIRYGRAANAAAASTLLLGAAGAAAITTATDLVFGPNWALYAFSASAAVFVLTSAWLALSALTTLPRGDVPWAARLHMLAAAAGAVTVSALLVWYNVPLFRF